MHTTARHHLLTISSVITLLLTPLLSYGQTSTEIKRIYFDANRQVIPASDSNRAIYYRSILYTKGIDEFEVADHYRNHNLLMTGHYSGKIEKGFENGHFKWYFENGNIFQVCSFVNGKLEGPYSEYDANGNKKALIHYVSGISEGCQFLWDESGHILRKGYFENGMLKDSSICDTLIAMNTSSTPVRDKMIPGCKTTTGNYCFINSTSVDLEVTLYIEAQGTGNYLQTGQFSQTSIRWSKSVTIKSGESKCITDLEITRIGFIIHEPNTFMYSSINYGGFFTIEKCKEKKYTILPQ